MTVYITHEMRGRDISTALEYGAVKVVLPIECQITDNPTQKGVAIEIVEDTLRDFNDEDYLLLAGDPACIAICFTIAALNNNGHVRILKWDRLRESYYPVEIQIEIGESDDV
jgi:hypothetical protein